MCLHLMDEFINENPTIITEPEFEEFFDEDIDDGDRVEIRAIIIKSINEISSIRKENNFVLMFLVDIELTTLVTNLFNRCLKRQQMGLLNQTTSEKNISFYFQGL